MPHEFTPDLEALNDLAVRFARAYPALAPRLAESSGDPDVERLLDAFAYLTEQVHGLLDAAAPAAAQYFAELLTPELSRPFPAASILELAPPKRGGRTSIVPGMEVESIPLDGTACRFRAWSAFDHVPWTIDDARIGWSAAEGQSLDLTLLPSNDGAFPDGLLASLFPLRVHLAGDSRAASTLLLYLRTHLTDIELRVGDESWSLGKATRSWGLRADEALLPPEAFEHPGLRLVREYFVLPAKFSFVELGTALAPATVPASARRVELRVRFDVQLPTTIQITKDNLRLNCVPVVNVFETTTDPIKPSLERPVHGLRPAGLPVGHGETYSVTRVLARVEGRPGIAAVASFSEFEAAPPESLPDVFYVARPVPSNFGSGNEIQLSLGSPAGAAPVPEIEFLSIEVRAGNGALPNALGIGDISIGTNASPRGVRFRNISAVSAYRAPPHGEELRWRTLATTALTALSITHKDTLQTLLHVLDLRPLGDEQAARAHAQKLEAIESVSAAPGRARSRAGGGSDPMGTLVLGADVAVDLSSAGFDGEGEALVFASVLSRLFAHEASLGNFVRTTVRVVETGRVFTFPALHGDRELAPAEDRGTSARVP